MHPYNLYNVIRLVRDTYNVLTWGMGPYNDLETN